MGLLTNSAGFREILEAKNFYNVDNIYNLNGDNISMFLNDFQTATGVDLQSSLVGFLAKRLADTPNSKLLQIANEEVLKQLGRGAASRAIAKAVPIVNPLNIFSKDPNAKVIYYPDDYKITQSPTKAGQILNEVGNIFGVSTDYFRSISDSQIFSKDNNSTERNDKYLLYTGDGIKTIISSNVKRNMFGNYTISNNYVNSEDDQTRTLGFYAYSDEYRSKAIDKIATYGGLFSLNKNIKFGKNPFSSIDTRTITPNTYDDTTNGTAKLGLSSTLVSGDVRKDVFLDDLGLGGSKVTNGFHWGGISGVTEPNVSEFDPNKVNRGLLYYTSQILKTDTASSESMNQTNTSFGSGDDILYKGTKCRSWTVVKQYGDRDTLIRGYGHGKNSNSVSNYSVVPKMFPKGDKVNDDPKRYMFSIENLAYSGLDYYNLPDCEKGYTGGRIMWFIPYGITLSETSDPFWHEERILGRIEPLYSYAGAKRTAQLNFTLLMDHPDDLKSTAEEVANFFANCNQTESPNVVPDTAPVYRSVLKAKIVNNQSINPDVKICKVYYDNDSNTIDDNYEKDVIDNDLKNVGGYNKEYFTTKRQSVGTLFSSDAGKQVAEVLIVGFTSKKWTNNYNAGLGFRRAFALMNDIQNNSSGSLKLSVIGNNFVDTTFTQYKDNNGAIKNITVDNVDTITFKYQDPKTKVIFILKSKGEESSNESTQDTNIDDEKAKLERRAEYNITKVNPDIATNEDGTPANVTTAAPIQVIADTSASDPCSTLTPIFHNNENSLYDESVNGKIVSQKNKYQHFSAAFISQTPENYHRRLTFLQQIVRPGTQLSGNDIGASNSIFGKAPVCVLRLGDFLHTKIIVKNISYDYGTPTWDLNPEGMGVQPMLCNVSMNIDIIGGQSLQYAIDSLQNSTTYNYYANSTFKSGYMNGKPESQQKIQNDFEGRQGSLRDAFALSQKKTQ